MTADLSKHIAQHRRIILASTVVPAIIFLLLRLTPTIDPILENRVFHFYIVSFASLTALVVAVFVLGGIGVAGSQAVFTAMGFAGMSGVFLLHGASTPNMLMGVGHGTGLSGRLSLIIGAIFLNLAATKFSPTVEQRIMQSRRIMWLILTILYAAYFVFVLAFPEIVSQLELISALSNGFAIVTILIFAAAFWQIWQQHRKNPTQLTFVLTLAIVWLTLAQISQWLAPIWRLSWWYYHVMMLAAYMLTMGVLISEYEQVRNFRVTHYFTALSVIIGIPVMGLISEATVRLSGQEMLRWPMFGISFLAVFSLYISLLIIVRRAELILKERTNALEAEKQWRVDFTNLLVHDLKNPLSVISVSTGLLLGGKLINDPEKQQTLLERVQRGSREAFELVENLLDIERLEAGSLKLTRTPTPLSKVIDDAAQSVKGLAEFNELELHMNVPDSLPTIAIDEVLIRRVLQNLLGNAIKFTPKGGQVKLDVVSNPEKVTLRVIDSGTGIPVSERQRIFEKFAQVKGDERRGTGLGLTFCKLVIEAHGGHIWVEDAPGQQGSCFTLTLPLE